MRDVSTTFHNKHLIKLCLTYEGFCCVICEEYIPLGTVHLGCQYCQFYFHKECPTTLLESSQTIYHPETHEHTLTFIRKMNAFNCTACGKVYNDKMNMYACLQCNFFVHRNCIYLPKVIKLTCHRHRLFQTLQFLDFQKCQICDQPITYEWGGYICSDKSCDYRLHSYCATRKEIWDGKDLKQEPEEIEDLAPPSLVEVDSKTSRHFSHQHDLMRLCFNDDEVQDGEICQACVLPIDVGKFLACKECDFALHDTCASLPRKLEHIFHFHPLTLEVNMTSIKEGFFNCSKCERESCGFMYRCYQEGCEFKMDAKCASLSDPLCNGAHQHFNEALHLFESGVYCSRCDLKLNPRRATLPVLVKYEYDIHPLALFFSMSDERLSYDSPVVLPLCCAICEVVIIHDHFLLRKSQDIYVCTECGITICVECAIGKYPYLKSGITINVNGFEIEISSNSLSRPICHACHCICRDKLVFKKKKYALFFCSIKCITSSSETLSGKTI